MPSSTGVNILRMSCVSYDFETGATSDIVAMRMSRLPEVSGEIVIDVPSS